MNRLVLAALLAFSLPAPAQEDVVRFQGIATPLSGHVEGFRGAKLEVRTSLGVVRVETRFLESVQFPSTTEALFEDDFPGKELGKMWTVDSGDWKVEDGSVVGQSSKDNAFLLLKETLKGDVVLDLDAEIHSATGLGGLHVGIGGQNWFLYPQWGGIYPPYQQTMPSQYVKDKDGGWSLKSHFRFVRKGRRYEFYVGDKLFMAADGAPSNLVDDHIILAAAHLSEVRYRHVRLSMPPPDPDAKAADFKAAGDVVALAADGKRLKGSLATLKPDALASAIPSEDGDRPLKGLAWIAFPPSAPAELTLELEEAARAKIDGLLLELGKADATSRERAVAGLTDAGPLAVPALVAALKSPDAALAARAKTVLESIRTGTK